jgi:hypothetical protein
MGHHCLITCRTRSPSSANNDSQQPKNSSIYSWPTCSIISLKNYIKDDHVMFNVRNHALRSIGLKIWW